MEYLPLGTIIMLKNGKKRLMIYGRKQINAQTKEVFDYVGCLYPEGNISKQFTFMFNQDEIEKVFFKGYADEEEELFDQSFLNKKENSSDD